LPGARVLAWSRICSEEAEKRGAAAEPERTPSQSAGRRLPAYAVATVGHLAVGRAGAWSVKAWHDIIWGGWDSDTGRLTWTDADGAVGGAVLAEPGLLPDVFRERVDAAVLLSERVAQGDEAGGSAVVAAWRQLGDPDAPPVWRVTPLDPAVPPSAATLAAARARLSELRRELP
jgi:hypothetical protein